MKVYRCKFCQFSISVSGLNKAQKKSEKRRMGEHYEKKHRDQIPKHMTGYRFFYYLLTGKDRGSCVVCKGETAFNEASMKYCRFCVNPACTQKYVTEVKGRMFKKYGKVHLLNDPDVQKRMLANRRISGKYQWRDGSRTFGYVGSYELHFLQFLDRELNWPSSDVMWPSPHVYSYEHNGVERFYIPDGFIVSLSAEIEIKDDGSAKQINPESRAKDRIKEEVMRTNTLFNYIKLVNKDYSEFLTLVKGE